MKVFRMLITIGTCMAIACTILMSFGMESVSAGTWDNAYTYYNKYGNYGYGSHYRSEEQK